MFASLVARDHQAPLPRGLPGRELELEAPVRVGARPRDLGPGAALGEHDLDPRRRHAAVGVAQRELEHAARDAR